MIVARNAEENPTFSLQQLKAGEPPTPPAAHAITARAVFITNARLSIGQGIEEVLAKTDAHVMMPFGRAGGLREVGYLAL